MEQAVEQHRSMPGRQDESIPIEPERISRIVLQKTRPKRVSHCRCAHRHAWVTRIRGLYRVRREDTDGVDAQVVESFADFGWQDESFHGSDSGRIIGQST